jgi:hypothetical protein
MPDRQETMVVKCAEIDRAIIPYRLNDHPAERNGARLNAGVVQRTIMLLWLAMGRRRLGGRAR